jgi:methylmalonyl-CoA mutase
VPALGITGTGGAGKSSLTDELVRRFRLDQDDALKLAIISIDPSRKRTGGALLGDRIRMNAIEHPNIFMRSLATRDTGKEVSAALPEVIAATRLAGFDMIIVETSGIGQGDAAIVPFVDVSLYVMTPEFGAASQLEKIDMLDFADFVAINKFDRKGAEDALRDVRKQYQRNRELFNTNTDEMPVFGTMAARFNDDGVTALFQAIAPALVAKGLKLGKPRCRWWRQGLQPRPPSCRPSAPATWPRSPRRCAATTSTPRAGPHRPRAPGPAHLQEAL